MEYGLRARFRDAWRELTKRSEPEPLPYSRLILICGMARTGTSALASYIGSHPEVRLIVGDGAWQNCESDLLRDGVVKWEILDSIMEKTKPWRVLIKQPWLETNPGFFDGVLGARTIVCFRRKETLFNS